MMFWVLMAGLVPGICFGVLYPAAALLWYKVRSRGKMTVREIFREINY